MDQFQSLIKKEKGKLNSGRSLKLYDNTSWRGLLFQNPKSAIVKPWPQTLSPKTQKPKTKGPWADTKML